MISPLCYDADSGINYFEAICLFGITRYRFSVTVILVIYSDQPSIDLSLCKMSSDRLPRNFTWSSCGLKEGTNDTIFLGQ